MAKKTETATQTETHSGRPVVVTTSHKGVFFGYLEGDEKATVLTLKSARNAFYWQCEGGIFQLGQRGPQKGSKVGDRATVSLRDVTAVIECSPEATAAWEAATWSR